ncbi:MAG: hypothetical protein ETSY1_18565 [Candidatus Entotheonella factor]|uniref:Fatty acid desaturase domain-containing protein n=1 Tax=Entotheonella factor TaxID=1429438 RepID=W4LKH6_ENTF1|nr:MAG: hypothetical protein ETSY1_18565 [Candidatus Entotheonella factor]
MTLLSLLGGSAISCLIVASPMVYWPLLVFAWLLTVHGARKAQLVICHHAVHANLTGNKLYDKAIFEGLSTFLLIQDYHGYVQDHIRLHHGPALATLEDPDVKVLLRLGFLAGKDREWLWRHLYWTLCSPRCHGLFLRARLKANFMTAPAYRRVMAMVYVSMVFGTLLLIGGWLSWLFAWFIPIVFLYHVAAILQFLSEHLWLYGKPNHKSNREDQK